MDKGSLRSVIEGPLTRGEEEIQLRDVISFSGWNWQRCSFSFPKQLLMEIKKISFSAQNTNWINWSSSPNGNFELKEAYKLATMEEIGSILCHFGGYWIWKAPTIPKIKCFLW